MPDTQAQRQLISWLLLTAAVVAVLVSPLEPLTAHAYHADGLDDPGDGGFYLAVDPLLFRDPASLPETGDQHELWPLLLLFGLVAIGSSLWRRRLARHSDRAEQEGE